LNNVYLIQTSNYSQGVVEKISSWILGYPELLVGKEEKTGRFGEQGNKKFNRHLNDVAFFHDK